MNSNVDNFESLRDDIETKAAKRSDFKDMTDKNLNLKTENCENKFKVLRLYHLNETYDDIIIERHPNLPKFLTEPKMISSSLPNIPSIRWTGTVFQESWRESPKFLLYSAHFETRLKPSLIIHILALYDGEKKLVLSDLKTFLCKMWFDLEDGPTVVPIYDATLLSYLIYREDQLNPYVISVQVPEREDGTIILPVAVSIVNELCQTPTNVLKISSPPPEKKKKKSLNKIINVGICGKALFYYNEDFSTRLIEWVEILKILGASKIFLYKTNCHENVEKVLDFYEKEGTVKLITFYYPPPYDQEGTFIRLWSKTIKSAYRGAQNIYVNDCLLRNKNDFDYLGVFDSDEIPILGKHHSLQEFLKSMKNMSRNKPESYFLKWKTFFKNLRSNTSSVLNETDRSYVFSHNIRTKLKSKDARGFETNGKTFHDTNQVVWANPHKQVLRNAIIAPKVRLKKISREIAYMGHFSSHNCVRRDNCYEGNMEEETHLLPFREKVVQKINKVLESLQI